MAFFELILLAVTFDLSFALNCSYNGSWQDMPVWDCKCLISGQECKDGIVVPKWMPITNLTLGDKIGRALVYLAALMYLFLGVSILADRFMAAIETITSQEREITVKKPSGETYKMTVRVWNETVSNLTLMALGSSAPEILLSIIEVCGNNFKAGELGPNTIVGSAAFNLFMIIGICVCIVPSNEIRRQQHLRVFLVTATWSVFAYVWMYLILSVISPGKIDIWEGALTFLFFPITVITAYIADKKLIHYKFLTKKYHKTKRGVLVAGEGDENELDSVDGVGVKGRTTNAVLLDDNVDPEVRAFEEHRQEYMEILRQLRKRHPNTDLPTLQQMAEYEMIKGAKKSRAFYRVQAVRKLTGGGNIVKKKLEKERRRDSEAAKSSKEAQSARQTCRIFFDPAHYTVLENVGTFHVTVSRTGGPPDLTVFVDFYTEDGTANAGSDYYESKGTLTFGPQDAHCLIPVQIIDDDIFEEDEYFSIHLKNLRVKTKTGQIVDPTKIDGPPLCQIETPASATVMILDDDHAGVFGFEISECSFPENVGHAHVKVNRTSGARGRVAVPYKTVDGTAKCVQDYEKTEGLLEFDNDEIEKTITIGIVNDEEYEKTETFFIELSDPIWVEKISDPQKVIERFKKRQRRKLQDKKAKETILGRLKGAKEEARGSSPAGTPPPEVAGDGDKIMEDLGKPRLGDVAKCTVKIKESKEFKGLVDRMIKTANVSIVLGTTSWREQFIDALTVNAGGDDDEGDLEDGEEEKDEKLPSCGDYFMHFLSVPWKVLCACCPPTEYFNGWACFVFSIALIGVFTAVIGDLANHFGCSIGLKDAVTAISFVAMGTSVPDTFASKVAAIQDKYADSSIGNVTGSNAVNVFLGIGIAWSICAVVAAIRGDPDGFQVEAGTLAFSVTIFCTEAVVAIAVILLRRLQIFGGGELGGPLLFKIPTSLFLVFLWVLYLLLSSLESYCIIQGF